VIAAGLAKGLRVGQLLDLYVTRGEEMFDKASLLAGARVGSANQSHQSAPASPSADYAEIRP
jgi:hypothetical protein